MNRYARLIAGVILAMGLAGGLVIALETRVAVDRVTYLLEMLRGGGVANYTGFVLIQAGVATVGIFPASLIAIAAGATYGLWAGFLLAAAGTLLGGWIAFLLSRSMFRPWIVAMLRRQSRFARFDEALGEGNWRFVCLMRISPIMPFSLTSYALGLTRIDQSSYMLGTLASMPTLLAYVASGAFAHSSLKVATGQMDLIRCIPLGIGVIATIAISLRLRKTMIRAMGEPKLQS